MPHGTNHLHSKYVNTFGRYCSQAIVHLTRNGWKKKTYPLDTLTPVLALLINLVPRSEKFSESCQTSKVFGRVLNTSLLWCFFFNNEDFLSLMLLSEKYFTNWRVIRKICLVCMWSKHNNNKCNRQIFRN